MQVARRRGVAARRHPAAGGPLVLDNFTGSAGALAAHVSDSGHGWTVLAGAPTINGAGKASGANAFALSDAVIPSADYTVVAEPSGNDCGLLGRCVDANNFYLLQRIFAVTRLYKRAAGGWTLLQEYGGVGTEYRLHMAGTTIEGILDGVTRISVVDNSLAAAGHAGLRLEDGLADSFQVVL